MKYKRIILPATALALMLSSGIALAETETPTETDSTAEVMMAGGAATWSVASLAAWAAPAVVAHSSGAAIMWSGAGYVAGTIGLASATVAALPFVAAAGAGVALAGAGYYVYDNYVEDKEETPK